MPESMESQVYRPGASTGCCFLAAAIPFAVIALFAPWSAGSGSAWCIGLIGAIGAGLGVFAGTTSLRTVVTLTQTGLTKGPRSACGFEMTWEQVNHWSVVDREGIEIWFTISGQHRAVAVYEHDVLVPGLEAFLAAVRKMIGDREIAGRTS
jgi:hypothetical protein